MVHWKEWLGSSDFTPHGFCLAWDPGLLWLHTASDALVALAYYSIPLALLHFARKRHDLVFSWLFRLFAAFILACGTTHVLGIATLWLPVYWLDGAVKAITAVLSVTTAVILWQLIPRALAIPSPSQLHVLNDQLSVQITEREAIAASLRLSEARLRSIYAHTPAPLHALDMEGRVIEVSERWLELLGYTRQEVIGQRLTRFIPQDATEQMRADWDQLLRDGSLRDLERPLISRSGERREMLVSARLERDEAGQVSHVMVALADVTARKQTEEALRASEECLRQSQKMEAVGQLTGGIAHDFNNMLTGVIGSMELLQRRVKMDEKCQRLMAGALQGASRAARLTSQLLVFSRRQRLDSRALVPETVVREMEELLGRTLGEKIPLHIEPHKGQAWQCLADRNQLEAALLNLTLNARAAMKTGGTLTFCFTNRIIGDKDCALAETRGEEAVQPGEYVSISVMDTGTGMTEEVRRKAFEPYFTTKPVGEGTGLGLSQIYGFARQSGGTVRIDSVVSEGTTIEILLPHVQAEMDGPAVDHMPASIVQQLPPGQGEVILVVEDEPALRQMAVEALTDYGYQPMPVCDADEALAALDAGALVDVLFTDIVMPGSLNGVELALEVRRRQPDMPVLFATGYSDRKVLARWPGRIELMAKPYSIDDLACRVADCVSRRKPVVEPA